MSNTIYIDANRSQSINQEGGHNEWTFKLNEPLELPKGTQINLQSAYINKKGITGGSIEIEEDIEEVVTFSYYIAEAPHIMPVASYTNPLVPWFRSTFKCSGNTYRGHFGIPNKENSSDVTSSQVKRDANEVVYSVDPDINKQFADGTPEAIPITTTASANLYNGTNKSPDFLANGGNGMLYHHIQVVANEAETHSYFTPVVKSVTIRVLKGIYGIGELAQLIEDQFTGVKSFDINTKTFVNNVLERRENPQDNPETFTGQMFNNPFIGMVQRQKRNFQTDSSEFDTSGDDPAIRGTNDSFLNARDYRELMEYLRDVNSDPRTSEAFNLQNNRGNPVLDGNLGNPNYGIKPLAVLVDSVDTGENIVSSGPPSVNIDIGHTADSDEVTDYNIDNEKFGVLNQTHSAMVGTSNFTFKYDTENNGFSINGLHNCYKSPTHDRYANPISSAGQQVVYFKKTHNNLFGAFQVQYSGGSKTAEERKQQIRRYTGVISRPDTRDTGVMILNWAKTTAERTGNVSTTGKLANAFRFQDFYDTDKSAREAWEKTLWFRLGFDFDQLCNENNYGTSLNYENPSNDGTPQNIIKHYGFTTDVELDNSVISTISTLNSSLQKDGAEPSDPKISGFQWNALLNTATPAYHINSAVTNTQFGGSLLSSTIQIPVVISDTGGLTAKRLPQLSKSAYFIVSSDLCDNYKDNVKQGDVLPILAVVPKTSLSNEDFIASQSDIIQVISNPKVVNKIKICVYNPDLTLPDLDPNSSVVLKIVRPNTTPTALLDPQQLKGVVQQVATEMGV
jgi:hypothetical protein